jgi:ubiquinone/menaquinone biosynthesis C-methylase UbiE
MQDSWLRLWEYSSAIIDSGVDSRMTVLDAGGTGTVFSYYLASEGCRVVTVDIDNEKVINANKAVKKFNFNMVNLNQSVTNLGFKGEGFDRVYSICVLEHLKIENQPVAIKELARVLKKGGILVLSFDFGKRGADNPILSKEEIISRIVKPSGLEIFHNAEFHTEVQDYAHASPDYTFGIVFLIKPGKIRLPSFRQIYLHPLCGKKINGNGQMDALISISRVPDNIFWKIVYRMYRYINFFLEEQIKVVR